jgi:hypothetical protein
MDDPFISGCNLFFKNIMLLLLFLNIAKIIGTLLDKHCIYQKKNKESIMKESQQKTIKKLKYLAENKITGRRLLRKMKLLDNKLYTRLTIDCYVSLGNADEEKSDLVKEKFIDHLTCLLYTNDICGVKFIENKLVNENPNCMLGKLCAVERVPLKHYDSFYGICDCKDFTPLKFYFGGFTFMLRRSMKTVGLLKSCSDDLQVVLLILEDKPRGTLEINFENTLQFIRDHQWTTRVFVMTLGNVSGNISEMAKSISQASHTKLFHAKSVDDFPRVMDELISKINLLRKKKTLKKILKM